MIFCRKVVPEILSNALENPILRDLPAANMTLTILPRMSQPAVDLSV
jgi:hypothetical protein